MKNKFLQIFVSVLIVFSFNQAVFAQKVKNIQENAVWAIKPVKVDGKSIEDSFQATNKSTQLSYTMSNDDKNLYLVIKSTDKINNNKIMMGGITLTINTEGKKKAKEGFMITYPVIARQQLQKGRGGQGTQGGSLQKMSAGGSDSAILARRKQQLAAAKEIKVLGFPDVTDTLISIYNEYEISVAANFDDKGVFLYELAIPLKLLGLTLPGKEFAYNIMVNGFQFGNGFDGGDRQVIRIDNGGFGGQAGGGRASFDPSAFLPTDFWGKYTLAKQ